MAIVQELSFLLCNKIFQKITHYMILGRGNTKYNVKIK